MDQAGAWSRLLCRTPIQDHGSRNSNPQTPSRCLRHKQRHAIMSVDETGRWRERPRTPSIRNGGGRHDRLTCLSPLQKVTCKLLIPFAATQVTFWLYGPGGRLVWASMARTPKVGQASACRLAFQRVEPAGRPPAGRIARPTLTGLRLQARYSSSCSAAAATREESAMAASSSRVRERDGSGFFGSAAAGSNTNCETDSNSFSRLKSGIPCKAGTCATPCWLTIHSRPFEIWNRIRNCWRTAILRKST